MSYATIADFLVVIHTAYVAFVVFGLVLIWIGLACGWQWTRNPWFRIAHLIAIGIVAVEAIFGVECPVTVWERELREAAGQTPSEMSFVGRLLDSLLFYENVPDWLFPTLHIGFGVLVLATFVLAPPRFRKQPRQRVALTSAALVSGDPKKTVDKKTH
jgi:hypothetical protein